MSTPDEYKLFTKLVQDTFTIYEQTGSNSRSNEKVKFLQTGIMNMINTSLDNKYHTKMEQNVPSINDTGQKKCDIIIYDDQKPLAVFPVKCIMSNYSQNKNNYFENLTGEITHIMWANKDIKICPINIVASDVPYKNKNGIITKFEHVGSKLDIYQELVKHGLCTKVINYIIDVKYSCTIGEHYKVPEIINIPSYTSIASLLTELNL
jgi:hypothetical protein